MNSFSLRSKVLSYKSILIVGAFANCLLLSEADAYWIAWGINAPTTVTEGSTLNGNFEYHLDLSDPPAVVLGYGAILNGSLSLGNGNSSPFTIIAEQPLGQPDTLYSVPFATTYSVPGTYKLGGSINYQDRFYCPIELCGSSFRTLIIPQFEVTVEKSSARINQHTSDLRDTLVSKNTLKLFTTLSSGGGITDAVSNFVSLWAESTGTPWGTILGVVIGSIGAGLIGGPLGLLVGTALLFTGAYYDVSEVVHRKLAADPPDPNYHEVYTYSDANFNPNLGLGLEVDQYFERGFRDLTRLLENKQGELTSVERAQGALIAGDFDSFKIQSDALESFRKQYEAEALKAGQWFSSLPEFITSHHTGTLPPNIEILFSAYEETESPRVLWRLFGLSSGHQLFLLSQ